MVLGMDKQQRRDQLDEARRIRWGNKTILERFWEKVEETEGCWLWNGYHGGMGYGQFWITPGRPIGAHRFAYQLLVGPIPDDFDIDHLCRNPRCVNPKHLEPVSHRENMRRSKAARKMACKLGHDWTNPKNVYIRKGGQRWCAECARTRWNKKRG